MYEDSPWFRLALCLLATWRVSHLVAYEDGPFDLIVRLRVRAGDSMLGKLMDCPYCLSLWVAAPAALLLADRIPEWCVAWLAISGGSTLIEKLSRSAREPDGAHEDALLRTETRDVVDPERAHADTVSTAEAPSLDPRA